MREYLCVFLVVFVLISCQSQKSQPDVKVVGGPCEGCEAIFEYGDRTLKSVDTLPNFNTTHPQLKISGVVYKNDGVTPAKDIILYAYHTNREGIYETKGDEKGWAKRHGYIRGWTKTDAGGNYSFFTFRPAAYPNGRAAEHIHITIKEPDKSEYYIEDILFDDDPLLTPSARKSLQQRGGSGIVKLKEEAGILVAQRDIILGLNIPDY